MKVARAFAVTFAAAALVSAPPSYSQFVKGNEAVVGGKVETPPVPRSIGKVCAAEAACHAGSWRMVETRDGLVECTEPYARQGSCRKSSYGTQKLRRVWVVKKGATWLQCQYPDIASNCADMFGRPPANLPADALQ